MLVAFIPLSIAELLLSRYNVHSIQVYVAFICVKYVYMEILYSCILDMCRVILNVHTIYICVCVSLFEMCTLYKGRVTLYAYTM